MFAKGTQLVSASENIKPKFTKGTQLVSASENIKPKFTKGTAVGSVKSYWSELEDKINFSTLQSDMSSLNTTLDSIYSDWQTPETLKKAKSNLKAVYSRLNALKQYNKYTGNTEGEGELAEIINAYKDTIDGWDDTFSVYGDYDDSKSYNQYKKQAEKTAEENEKMKAADLNALQKEIDDLKSQLEKAEKNDKHIPIYDRRGSKYDIVETGFGEEVNALKEQISEKTIYLNRAKWLQKGAKMSDVFDENSEYYDKDFEKYIKIGSETDTVIGDTKMIGGAGKARSVKVEDKYRQFAGVFEAYLKSEGETGFESINDSIYSYMTLEELEKAAYFIGKDIEAGSDLKKGGKFLKEYLNTIEEDLETRKATKGFRKIKDNNFLELLYGVEAGLDQFATGITNLTNTSDEYIPVNATQQLSGMIREDLKNDGIGWGLAYDGITTVSNMAPSILASAVSNFVLPGSGAYVGATLMGASAAGNAYQEKLNLGWDKTDARVYSTIVGVSEAGLSAALSGVSKLGGAISEKGIIAIANGIDNAIGKFAVTYGGKILSEVTEESLQEILNPLFENIALGYSKNDISDIEWGQVAYTAMLTVLTTGVIEFVPSVNETVKSVKKAQIFNAMPENMQSFFIEKALSFDTNTEANKLASKYNTNKQNGKKVTGTQLSNIFDEIIKQTKKSHEHLSEWASVYEALTLEGFSFPQKVDLSFKEIKNSLAFNTTEDLPDSTVGNLILGVTIYSNNEVVKTIDGGVQNSYNNVRGDNNELFEQGGVVGGNQKSYALDRRGTAQDRRYTQENQVTFERRVKGLLGAAGQRVANGKTVFAYKTKIADNSNGGKAYKILKANGYKVVFCEGLIYRNDGEYTVTSNEAVTTPDGTIYISSNATLRAEELVYHEIIHVAQNTNNDVFFAYESTLCELLTLNCEAYYSIANLINENNFGGKYNIEEIDSWKPLFKELSAYVNQYVMTDPDYAKQLFADMFEDWSAVVLAAEQFNKDIGADFTESVSFFEENDNSEDKASEEAEGDGLSPEMRERLFTEADSREIYRPPSKEEELNSLLGERKTAKQRQVEAVASKFGIKIIWNENISRGMYDPELKAIHINSYTTLSNAYVTIFKHEFVHYLEGFKGYEKFKSYLFKSSVAFEEYVREKLGDDFSGSKAEAFKVYTEIVLKERKNNTEIPKRVRDKYTKESIEREIVADFVGERLLMDENGLRDWSKTEEFLNDLKKTDRNLFQKIIDWVRDLISRFKGESQNRTLSEDLSYLEERLAAIYDSKEKKNASKGGEKYSVIKENTEVLALISNVKSGKFKPNEKVYFENVSDELATKITALTDVDVKGFKVAIEARQIEHILKDHGKNGKTDHSMANDSDIAKIEYVLNNAESINRAGKTQAYTYSKYGYNKTADTIKYEKLIGNKKYYVVQAVADTKAKTLYIVTAYIEKIGTKKEVAQLINAKSPDATSKDGSVVTSNNSIPDFIKTVKENSADIDTDDSTESYSVKKLQPIADTENFAKRVLRRYRSSADIKSVSDKVKGAAKAIESKSYAESLNYFKEAAREVIESSKDINVLSEDATDILKLVRNSRIKLSDVQKSEAAYAYGSYGKFRKSNMGRLNITNDGLPLDSAWLEWSEQYPNVFDSEISDAEMAVELARIVEGLKSNYEAYDIEGAAEYLASEMFNNAIDEMEDINSKKFEAAAEERVSQESAAKKYWEKRAGELERRNARKTEQLKKRRNEVSREITEQREERADKQKNIEFIRREVKRLEKKLSTNSENNHIPENLKSVVESMVSIFMRNDSSPFNSKDIRTLRQKYLELILDSETGVPDLDGAPEAFDGETLSSLKMLSKILDGKTLREINNWELIAVRTVIENIAHMVSMQNEMFVAGKQYEIDQLGNSVLDEISSVEKSKRTNALISKKDTFYYGNMLPIYFFKNIGGTLQMLSDDIFRAQGKCVRNMETAETFIKQIKKKHNYQKWGNETLEFETEKGENVRFTIEQAMHLYATAKREYGNQIKETEHLFRGGIVIEPSKNTMRDVWKDINKKAKDKSDIKTIMKSFSDEVIARAIRITPEDIGKVTDWLTAEQKAYIEEFVGYLSNDMAELGNETSMQLFGIRKYNDNWYIPYNSAENYLYSQPGLVKDARLKNQSFTKDVTHKANNPLIVSDFSFVCADHIRKMCTYNAFTIPLENLNKIFNYKPSDIAINKGKSTSVKAEIERVYGNEAVNYIKQFLIDVNGGMQVSYEDKMLNRALSLYKKGAVLASLSVAIQQPASVIRAMAFINPKYFVKTSLNFSERSYQEACKYAPVAVIKEIGRFDTGVGKSFTNWLLQEEYEGKDKLKANFTDSDFRDDKLSYFAAKADEITWGHIWAAVKAEIADTTDLTKGSDKYFEKCGERFEEVINLTQVYDSTLSRSQWMRNKSAAMQSTTAFMSEPTVSLNLLMWAVEQAKSGGTEGRKAAVKAISAVVGNIIFTSLLKSLVVAGRDDDEEKTYLEKYVVTFFEELISSLNPLTYIPYIRDIVSVFEGYTVEKADVSLYADLAQSIKDLKSDNKGDYEKIESVAGSLAAFLGLPVKNVLRDFRTVYNITKDFFFTKGKTDINGIFNSIKEGVGFEATLSEKYEKLAKAGEKGKTEKYDQIYENLQQSGKDAGDIKSGVKAYYRKDKEVKKEADELFKGIQNNKTFEGLEDEDKEELKKDIISSLATEKTVSAMAREPDMFDELYEAKRTNRSLYNKKKKEMIDNGMSESLIDDGIEIARIAYMKAVGIDVSEYLLYKIATSKKYADTDKSGGVSRSEENIAINKMDLDSKSKNYFRSNFK